jgi:hypothetical protein
MLRVIGRAADMRRLLTLTVALLAFGALPTSASAQGLRMLPSIAPSVQQAKHALRRYWRGFRVTFSWCERDMHRTRCLYTVHAQECISGPGGSCGPLPILNLDSVKWGRDHRLVVIVNPADPLSAPITIPG